MSASDEKRGQFVMSLDEEETEKATDGVYLIFKRVPTTFFQRLLFSVGSEDLEDPFLIHIEEDSYFASDWQGKSPDEIKDFSNYVFIPISDNGEVYREHLKRCENNRLGFTTDIQLNFYDSPSAYFWHFIKNKRKSRMPDPPARVNALRLFNQLNCLLSDQANTKRTEA